jgi:hypothetical protein
MVKHYSSVALSLSWIAFIILSSGSSLTKGLFLIFEVDKGFIHSTQPEYSGYEIWEMHVGVWGLFAILIFSACAIVSTIKIIRCRRGVD